MGDDTLSRRLFLQAASTAGGSSLMRLTAPLIASIAQAACTAKLEQSAFTVLQADEARDFAAISAHIIPTTDTPGANEAGVVHFFDQAFANEMRDALEIARGGLRELNESSGEHRFADLDENDQDASLRAIDGKPFFELMRTMTIFGFFAISKYGGNNDNVGWKLIDFDGHHGAWLYPFGAYDAEVHDESASGE